MIRQSIRHRKRRRKLKQDFELQLTSMMDMLIILVVFLLKSYAANAIALNTSPNIKLPVSTAEELPADSINLIVDITGIILDGTKIVEFVIPPGLEIPTSPSASPGPTTLTSNNATYEIDKSQLADAGRKIVPLFDALVKARENTELLMSKAVWKDKDGKPTDPKFQGALILQADKGAKYDTLRKVMYTAGAAQYKVFKMVAIKKETE